MSDPIKNVPPAGRVLFETWAEAAAGFPREAVMDAAANMLVNALRQEWPRRDHAERAWDEVVAGAKDSLMRSYVGAGGRLQGIYPFDQYIIAPTADFRDPKKRFPQH